MCPRLGGSAFFENGQRDLGVSSKAHKFACELRALLASDKHLGSAERSERQLPTPNTPASARGTVADPSALTRKPPRCSCSFGRGVDGKMNGLGWFNLHVMLAPGVLSVLVRKHRLSPRQNLILHFCFSLSLSLSLISVSVLVLILVLDLVLVVVLVFILLL